MSLNFKFLFTRPRTPDSVSVMLARFPQGRSEDPDCTNWLMRQAIQWYNDPRIHTLFTWQMDDTPVTTSRNACIEAAKECGADFVLMLDSDMSPDCEPDGTPFWLESFNFALERRAMKQPCVIAAPYCGPPPVENVYIFKWVTDESYLPADDTEIALEQFTRDEACRLKGIMEVAALPTGLFLLDMQGISRIDPPYFYYEFPDKFESKKASTEDVTFTRDLSLRGIQQFCNWNAWAGHWKWKKVRKPKPINATWVSEKIKRGVKAEFNIGVGERLIDVQDRTTLQVKRLSEADRIALGILGESVAEKVIENERPKTNGRSVLGFAGYAYRHPDYIGITDRFARPRNAGERQPASDKPSDD